MHRARVIRNAAVASGLGLTAAYLFEAAQHRRNAANGFELVARRRRARLTSPAW